MLKIGTNNKENKCEYNDLENKIEKLRDSIKHKKNIGIEIISLLENEDEILLIHNRSQRELNKALNSYSGIFVSDPEIIFISLTIIAIMYYDGSFYEHVSDIYSDLYGRFSGQKIEGLIRTVLNRYRDGSDGKKSKARMINVVLENSIVPSYFLTSFFDFIYDIYKINFDYNVTDEVIDDFKFVYDGIKNISSSNDDEIHLNVTKKTYKLIKSTKQLLLYPSGMEAIIALSIKVIRIIDNTIWNQEVVVQNLYLKKGYEGWLANLKAEQDVIELRERSEFKSRWEPKYILDNNRVLLVPPIHRIKAEHDYRNIRVIIKNGEKVISENIPIDIREIIGGYKVHVDRVHLTKPLGLISYVLMCGNEVIYSSGERLHRKYIVFDAQGTEIHNNRDFTGVAVFCTMSRISGTDVFFKNKSYALSNKYINSGDVVLIGEDVFSFSTMVKPEVIGQKYEGHYLVGADDDVKIPVFKSNPDIVFETEKDCNKLCIKINNKIFTIHEFKYTYKDKDNAFGRQYIVKTDGLDKGIYYIKVYYISNNKEKTILNTSFAIDSHLKVATKRIGDNKYIINIESIFWGNKFTSEIDDNDFKENWLQFRWKGIFYTYYIPLDITFYRINNGCWKRIASELWIGDINQDTKIDVYGTDYDTIQLLSNKREILEESMPFVNKGVFRQTNLGFLGTYKINYDYVIIVLIKQGEIKHEIKCFNKCIMNKKRTTITYNYEKQLLCIHPMFHGRGNILFKVFLKSGEEIYCSNFIENNMEYYLSGLESFTDYKILFYEKLKGIVLKKERELLQKDVIFYNREDFVGRTFKISEVYFDQCVGGAFLHKHYNFNNTYIEFLKMNSNSMFEGNIYAKTYSGKYTLNNINPVDIEICSDVIDGEMELSITKNGDGLLMDFRHRGIMNSLDSKTATDIYSYKIEV